MLVSIVATLLTAKPIVLIVSDDGNDKYDGGYAIQNHNRKRGPLKTFEGVLVRLREIKDGKTPIEVHFESILETRTKPIVLTPEDSGTADAPVTFKNVERVTSVIYGYHNIQDEVDHKRTFKVGKDGWWHTNVGDFRFEQLSVDSQHRFPARLPKKGYFIVDGKLPPTPTKGTDKFRYANTDIDPNWHNREDIDVVFFHNWSVSHNRIKDIDDATKTITFAQPTGYADDWAAFRKGDRYIVSNVKEGLGEPGSWYLDHKSGDLTYCPMPGESLDNTHVDAPVTSSLLEIKGVPARGKFVEHLNFQGFNFTGTSYTLPKQGRFFPQAEIDLGGTISLTGARDIEFKYCAVFDTGAYAIDIGAACQRVTVRDCFMEDLGAGGVKIGETRLEPDASLITKQNKIVDCQIKSGGRLHPAAIGVWIGQSPYNVIKNNWIEDFYYTGVSVGWSWGYGPSGSHHNLIEGNTITKIGQGVLSDMGGVYLLGLAPGTIVRGNRISDVKSYSYGGWGLYTDEGSTGVLLEKNVVFRTKSAGFHQHYGKDNRVTNNVFADGDEHQVMRTRAEDHQSFRFDHNIVLFDKGDLLGSNWTGPGFSMDHNLYWRGGTTIDFVGLSWDAWRAAGHDQDSEIADPLFVDDAHGDFSLKSDSPGFKLGFQAFDALAPKVNPYSRKGTLPKAWP